MKFFCVFPQYSAALLVLITASGTVFGADPPPNVNEVCFGVNLLLGKPPNEDNSIKEQKFKFGEAKDVRGHFQTLEGMYSIRDVGRNSCLTKKSLKENYWSMSTSSMESEYSSTSIGYDDAVNIGVTIPVKAAEVSIEKEIRTTMMFGNSEESNRMNAQSNQGYTASSIMKSSRNLYTVGINYEKVEWESEFLSEIAGLDQVNQDHKFLEFFYDHGTHLYTEANFGYTCHQTIFFESGYDNSEYGDFISSGSTNNFELYGFQASRESKTTTENHGTSDQGFKYASSDMTCQGETRTGGCGKIQTKSDLPYDEAPVIIGWSLKPIWDVDIPGLKAETKESMKRVFNKAMEAYVKCSEDHCNGRGGCKPLSSGTPPTLMQNLYDATICICFGNNEGEKCNLPPISKKSESFKVDYNWGPKNSYDREFSVSASYGAISGVKSVHNNKKEDREFEWKKTKFTEPGKKVNTSWLGRSEYDKHFRYECPKHHVISYLTAKHSNKREDRTYHFGCDQYENYLYDDNQCNWGKTTEYDKFFEYKCTDKGIDWVLTGVDSTHDNGREDRKFSFKCCKMKRTYPPLSSKTLTH